MLRTFLYAILAIFTYELQAAPSVLIKFNKEMSLKSLQQLSNHHSVEYLNLSFGQYLVIKDIKNDTIKTLVNSGFDKDNLNIFQIKKYKALLDHDIAPKDLIWDRSSQPGKDEMFSKQWGLNNLGNPRQKNKGFDMNAINAWKISKGSKHIKVAVIDSGVQYDHPDLKDNMWINTKELNGQTGIDDDQNGFIDDIYGYDFANDDANPMDDHGHGTHVAGIIGALHNGKGIMGLAPNVTLLPIKFLDKNNNGDTVGALKSIDYAIKAGVQVINASWGSEDDDEALHDAFKAAHNEGIICIAASGNSHKDNDKIKMIPANYPETIAVAAFQENGFKKYTSNWGLETVHTVAPGDEILSTDLHSGYRVRSGTSMAAPFVTGMVVLFLAKNADLNFEQIEDRILRTSVFKNSWKDIIISSGRADAYTFLMDISQARN